MNKSAVLSMCVILVMTGASTVQARSRASKKKGYSFPVATYAEGNNASVLRRFLKRNGFRTFEESKDYGYIVWVGPFRDESRARYLEPFFCLRTKEYGTRQEAEEKASFIRDRNFPAMVDSRYDIGEKKRLYWVYIGYTKTRQEAVEVLKGFAYYPDATEYLNSLDPEDETAITYSGGYLAHPDMLFGAADIIGDRSKELLIQEDRTDEYEIFSEIAPPSNKAVDVKRLGYSKGPLNRDIGVYYYDDVSGGWKKAGVMPLGSDPMSFVVNSDVKLLFRNFDSDKDKEIIVGFDHQEREGSKVCSSRGMVQVFDLRENPVIRYKEVKLAFDVLDSNNGALFKAIKKNKKWKGDRAPEEMLSFAEKKGLDMTALSIEAGRIEMKPSLKVKDQDKVLGLLKKMAASSRCKAVTRCGNSRHVYNYEAIGPTLERLAGIYTGSDKFFDLTTSLAAKCNECASRGWREGLPHCAEFYKAIGTVMPKKGKQLSTDYFREGMKNYVRIDEKKSAAIKALLDFLHAGELDPDNGEALYKAACVAAKRNNLAFAMDLLNRAFDISLTFKARARDDDNFSELRKSPKYSDMFEDQ
ncbi:MAG: hypothetical protein GXP49_05475 [Deltaproteobacteria bacterium]|nr:hypothetical protein [Deltaproteobacteria bacterium]